MRIRFTLDITRSPKPVVDDPNIYDLNGSLVENTHEQMPAGFMGKGPKDPCDKR